MSDHFITESGHRIDFVPGYFERNRFYADLMVKRDSPTGYDSDPGFQGFRMPFYMIAKDWALFSALVYFLERNGLLGRWRAGIDLGGAEGSVIRFFKACGLIDKAINLDVIDFSKVSTDEVFADFIRRTPDVSLWGAEQHEVTVSIDWAKIHQDFLGGSSTLSGMVLNFPAAPTLDQNLVMSAYDAPGTYDLVVANALLEFVDLDLALPKIRSILDRDGIFVGSINAAWCPVTPAGMLGHFPYLHQRLSLGDAKRYYEEHHPELLKNIDRRYNWYHDGKYKPTLKDWFEITKRHGLRIAAYERVSPKQHQRYEDTGSKLLQTDWFDPEDVLQDAHRFNPTVTIDDLMTATYRMVMKPA